MIVKHTSRTHSEFDIDAAAKLFAGQATAKELSGELITSAFDLYSVETLRDRHGLRLGEAYPTDIFVFGKGEPDNPACTKVGGRPLWPDSKEWPASPDGSPKYFLAQFNFSDSGDIIGDDIEGHVLLLLTDSTNDWLWSSDGLSFY